jgi:hypothetical protein
MYIVSSYNGGCILHSCIFLSPKYGNLRLKDLLKKTFLPQKPVFYLFAGFFQALIFSPVIILTTAERCSLRGFDLCTLTRAHLAQANLIAPREN